MAEAIHYNTRNEQINDVRQPFRVVVVQHGWQRRRVYNGRGPNHKGAYTAIAPVKYAFVYWTEDTSAEPWRAGYGSFCLAGIHATRRAVEHALADPRTYQISIRTNQDRTWFVVNRHADGRVTSYDAREDC